MGAPQTISQDSLYADVAAQFGAALDRLASAYEADPDRRRDLLQDIHLQLWLSFERFDGRCSLRTWVYRVGHNVCASHVLKERRVFGALVGLEEMEQMPDKSAREGESRDLDRLAALIQQLKPLDRQVIVSYLEDLGAADIGEITGLSPANVSMRVHRIKRLLASRFQGESSNAN